MLLEMFFNELSLANPAASVEIGHERLAEFMTTVIAARQRGVRPVLRTTEDFHIKQIAPEYNWYDWSNDGRVDLDLRRYFLSITTKAPFLQDNEEAQEEWLGIDCYWQTTKALGLKAAYVADGLAFSIRSSMEWDSHSLSCEIQKIINEEIKCRDEVVHHASVAAHVEHHTDWIQQRVQQTILNTQELAIKLGESFPGLTFCPIVKKQIADLPREALSAITRGLYRLNLYCTQWETGAFDPTSVGCSVSTESESTLRIFSSERTFNAPDNTERVFSWHAKVGRWRIHFDPSVGPGALLIGYVGPHLRTARFR